MSQSAYHQHQQDLSLSTHLQDESFLSARDLVIAQLSEAIWEDVSTLFTPLLSKLCVEMSTALSSHSLLSLAPAERARSAKGKSRAEMWFEQGKDGVYTFSSSFSQGSTSRSESEESDATSSDGEAGIIKSVSTIDLTADLPPHHPARVSACLASFCRALVQLCHRSVFHVLRPSLPHLFCFCCTGEDSKAVTTAAATAVLCEAYQWGAAEAAHTHNALC